MKNMIKVFDVGISQKSKYSRFSPWSVHFVLCRMCMWDDDDKLGSNLGVSKS
jgi:hypothetical protein